jgi:hypothetical protein
MSVIELLDEDAGTLLIKNRRIVVKVRNMLCSMVDVWWNKQYENSIILCYSWNVPKESER